MTQQLSTVDGRSVLHMERRIAHAPDRVWRALMEPARLADWFPGAIDIELRVGGVVTFGDGAQTGTVTDLDPPHLVAYTWDTDHLRFELRPDGDGTVLVLTHTFDDRAGAASFAAGWHTCVVALDLALAGRAGADPGVDHVALHEHYLAELGLLTGTAEATAQGWEVRVERQLVRPAQEVWAVLAGGAGRWPGAGAVTRMREPELVEREVATGGWVRWELRPGTGHGARLLLVRSGPPGTESERDRALAEAPGRVAELSAAVGRLPVAF